MVDPSPEQTGVTRHAGCRSFHRTHQFQGRSSVPRADTEVSGALYERARKVIPAGLTHDSRTLLPYPIYAARAAGSRKWDVDGNASMWTSSAVMARCCSVIAIPT